MHHEGAAETVKRVVPESRYIYVSIDTDVLDASIVPGSTLPEPGGLTYLELIEGLAAVTRKGQVIGFDIVEVNPPHDPHGLTARTAGWIMFEFVRHIAESRR